MEILIGRQVDAANHIKVPDSYGMVSRTHAKFIFNSNEMLIEDKSANGTYVNGNQIVKKILTANDHVVLGDLKNGYVLNLKELIAKCNAIQNQNKTDFSEEFQLIENSYFEYKKVKDKIKRALQKKQQLPRIFLVLGSMAVFFLISYTLGIPQTYMILFSTVIPLVAGFFININFDANKFSEQDQLIKHEYSNRYVCPKCKNKLNLDLTIEILKKEKKCPHNCGAIFYK
jgi:hypothetical protein